MSRSSSSLPNEEKHIALPIIDNADLKALVTAINENTDKVNPENISDQHTLAVLAQTLNNLQHEAASPARSLKIHSEIMKVYLLNGFVEQRKLITKGDPSIRTALGAALEQFKKETSSTLFLGDYREGTKSVDQAEMKLMDSVRDPDEISEIVKGSYARAKAALREWVIDTNNTQRAQEAQRIYQNAKFVVMELEHKNDASSHQWNALLAADGLDYNTPLAIPISASKVDKHKQDNREKHSVEKFFSSARKDIVAAVNQAFYPTLLIHLLEETPQKPLSQDEKAKLDQLVKEIKRIEASYPNIVEARDQIQADIYKACMQTYDDAYIRGSGKDGRNLTKSPLLKHLENSYQAFAQKSKNTMFFGTGEKLHDKILNSQQVRERDKTYEGDSTALRTQKYFLMQELVADAFRIAVTEGLLGTSDKSEDLLIYAVKSIEKKGPIAKREFNKHAEAIVKLMDPPPVVDPKTRTKEMRRQADKEAALDKKFSNFLVIKDNVEIKEEDLRKLFELRNTPRLKEALQKVYPAQYLESIKPNADADIAKMREISRSRSIQSGRETGGETKDNSPASRSFSSGPRLFDHKIGDSTATTAANSAAQSNANTRRPSIMNDDVIPPPPSFPPVGMGAFNIPPEVKSRTPSPSQNLTVSIDEEETLAPPAPPVESPASTSQMQTALRSSTPVVPTAPAITISSGALATNIPIAPPMTPPNKPSVTQPSTAPSANVAGPRAPAAPTGQQKFKQETPSLMETMAKAMAERNRIVASPSSQRVSDKQQLDDWETQTPKAGGPKS